MNRTLTGSMIVKLKAACASRMGAGKCLMECWWVGWCDECWKSVGYDPVKRPEDVGESCGVQQQAPGMDGVQWNETRHR